MKTLSSICSIHELLTFLKARNCAPLGHKSVDTLYSFLQGFSLALRGDESLDAEKFLSGFNKWVRRRYNVESDQEWSKIIAFYSTDEASELSLFWKLYEDYRSRRAADRERRSAAQERNPE